MRCVVVNRDYDELEFALEHGNNNLIVVTGSHNVQIKNSGFRKKYEALEPSGGPFMSKGMTMGFIHKMFNGRIVRYFTMEDGKIYIHLYPERIFNSVINGMHCCKIFSECGKMLQVVEDLNHAVSWVMDYERR